MLRRSVQLLLSSENGPFDVFSKDFEPKSQLGALQISRKNSYCLQKIVKKKQKSSKTMFFDFVLNRFRNNSTNPYHSEMLKNRFFAHYGAFFRTETLWEQIWGNQNFAIFSFFDHFLDLDDSGCLGIGLIISRYRVILLIITRSLTHPPTPGGGSTREYTQK